jgi:XTP/dITP diphosphohydrolase
MTYPRQLVIATGNRKKGVEMAAILGGAGLEILTLADFPDADAEVEETGATYMENAEMKARAAAQATGRVCIADDAGLEIDAFGGAPGLYSKRFMGEETPFPEKMAGILERMKDVPEEARGCRFNCAVAIATPDGRVFHCRGVCEGRVAREMRGSYGFGYDPIFYLPELGRHMAELPPEEKHRISHRGKALACAKEVLAELFVRPAGMGPQDMFGT